MVKPLMFKKRTIKSQPSAKRRLDLDERGDPVSTEETETPAHRGEKRTSENSIENNGSNVPCEKETLGHHNQASPNDTKEQALSTEKPLHKRAKKQLGGVKLGDSSVVPLPSTFAQKSAPRDRLETGSDNGPQTTETDTEAPSLAKALPLALKPLAANIRTTTITDFAPDLCKDFLQTGYCGYGDTCKFLHVRDELRQSKPITRDWEVVAKGTKPGSTPTPDSAEPLKCSICKQSYVSPVKTSCGHVFCKLCFLKRCGKAKACLICGQDTHGVMIPVKIK